MNLKQLFLLVQVQNWQQLHGDKSCFQFKVEIFVCSKKLIYMKIFVTIEVESRFI